MRFNILQLLNKLRFHSQGPQGKEITDADILNWANSKVKASGRTSRMESFKVLKCPSIESYFLVRKLWMLSFVFFSSGQELIKWIVLP